MRRVATLLLLPLLVGAASAATPMQLREDGPQGRIFVPCKFDAASTECLLDSGSSATTVPDGSFWDSYKGKPSKAMSGSGHVQVCDDITVDEASVGDLAPVKKLTVMRCPASSVPEPRVGLDFLRGRIVRLDFTAATIADAAEFPAAAVTQPLLDLKGKNIFVKVTLAGKESDALFDTGAALSVVDEDFVKKHPELFAAEGPPTYGKDSANKEMKVQLYKVKSVTLGAKTFEDSYAIGMDFSPFRDIAPSGSVYVVGYNLIRQQTWTLDVDHGVWAAQ